MCMHYAGRTWQPVVIFAILVVPGKLMLADEASVSLGAFNQRPSKAKMQLMLGMDIFSWNINLAPFGLQGSSSE